MISLLISDYEHKLKSNIKYYSNMLYNYILVTM